MIVFIELLLIIISTAFLYAMFITWFSKKKKYERIINNSTITQKQWDDAYYLLPLLKGLSEDENKRLKELCVLFMHEKTFEGAQGFQITPRVMLVISLQACLPVLNLGLECYENFSTIIIYPAGFKTNRKITDENGVVDYEIRELVGESWLHGPVILSWPDSEKGGKIDGSNLVIHEFAHKLDMQNGAANGFPPLHNSIDSGEWFSEFSKAFTYFEKKCRWKNLHGIDCYAAASPAEFFSVFSEAFFERPDRLKRHFPEIHTLLELYYRQTPINRLS